MKMKYIYLSIISIFCCFTTAIAQDEIATKKQDTTLRSQKYGIRAGVDLSRLLRTAIDDDYQGFEVVADYRLFKNYYIAAEFGNESLLTDEENLNVKADGSFIRIGMDYNTYDNWFGMQNSIYVGLRYGLSTFSQTLNDYTIYTDNTFFDPDIRDEVIEQSGLTASWIGLKLGIKAELLKNLFLDINVSIRRMVNEETPDRFDNLYIPGFGKTNDFSKFGAGYGYTITYLLPFYKKKK